MGVRTAASGEEALEIYSLHEIDVVITDVQMGGMSGFDLLKRLKLIDAEVKVLVITSYNSYESVLNALQLGAYDYIQKPLTNPPAVIAAIQRAYESVKLQQENRELLEQLKLSHDQLADANRSLKEANRKLKRLACTDSLTNLYNRRFFDQVMDREVRRRNRYSLSLSLIMLDIDNFKNFNDEYGHLGGDIAIKAVADTLTRTARTTDIIARYGGEEFAVVLPQTDPAEAMALAERLRSAMQNCAIEIADNQTTSLTLSIGVTGVYEANESTTAELMVVTADKALYSAKQQGKNRCQSITLENKPRAA